DAAPGQAGAVVARLGPVASPETATVEVHQYRQFPTRAARRRPHIEVQAILTHAGRTEHHVAVQRALHATRTEMLGLAHAGPGGHRLRRLPAQGTDRWRGIRNPLEFVEI